MLALSFCVRFTLARVILDRRVQRPVKTATGSTRNAAGNMVLGRGSAL